jgi:hypothetical protein
MKRIGIAAVTLLALVAAPSASARRPSHKVSAKCAPGHPHLLVADAQAQVYEAPTVASLPEFRSYFGCAYGHGEAYDLGLPPGTGGGSPGGGAGTDLYTLAGPIVALEENSSTERFTGTTFVNEVEVVDLRNGRVLHRVPTGTPTAPPKNGDIGIGGATAIVLKSDGAVAWIVGVGGTVVEYQVHAVDSKGSRVLASGPEIDPRSLALAGSTIYWTQGGKPFSAPLS